TDNDLAVPAASAGRGGDMLSLQRLTLGICNHMRALCCAAHSGVLWSYPYISSYILNGLCLSFESNKICISSTTEYIQFYVQLLKKLSRCFAILERLTWHKSNKLSN